MSDRLFIEHPDGASLGSSEEILSLLKQVFTDVRYELLTESPEPEVPSSDFMPVANFVNWLRSRPGMGYPHYEGFIGHSTGFRVRAKSSVMRIDVFEGFSASETTALINQLLDATGWVRKPVKWSIWPL